MTRVLLVGAGGIGRAAHLPALDHLRRRQRLEIAGICDANAGAARDAAQASSVARHGTDMLALARDTGATAIALAVPPGANVPLAIAALEHGLHVVTEKPPARDSTQAEAMAAVARAHPELVSMVAFNRRHAPLYRRAIAASLAIAPPHLFSARFTRPALGQAPSNTATDWLTSDAAHVLDLAVATMGWPQRLCLLSQTRGSGPANVWQIQLQCPSGSAALTFDFAAGRRVERFEWSGADYDALLELPERAEWSIRGKEIERWVVRSGGDEPERIAVDYGFVDEYDAFVHAIEGTAARPLADFAYGARFMQLVETLLGMKSGEIRNLPPARELAPPVSPAGAARRPQGAPAGRPSVLILQNPAARQRQFDAPSLTRIGECAALSFQSQDLVTQVAAAHAVVTGWGGVPLDAGLLAGAERLALVVVVGSSAQPVMPQLLIERGIAVCTTADAVARSVAEHCLTLTLAGLRRLTDVDRQMHRGGWPPATAGRFDYQAVKRRIRALPGVAQVKPILKPLSQQIERRAGLLAQPAIWRDLEGLIVGLIGWGHTARHFARMLAPLGCEILVHSSSADPQELAMHGTHAVGLSELIGVSTVVSLHRGLTARTRQTLGAAEIERLRAGALLINTARAGLVDEQALIARLRRGDIVAALDVFASEPLPASDALRRLPNVILTPHSASSTPQCQRRAGGAALQIVDDWLSGRPVPALTRQQLSGMT